MAATKQRFRIFIGSPGDMAPERDLTEQVIGQLQAQYGGWVDLVFDRYEKMALPANEPPQRNISDPAAFDVAIFLFWHSVGSQELPDEFRMTDGSQAASGTLWEFDRAYFGVEQDGAFRRPFLLAYKKMDPLAVGSAVDVERAQKGFDDIDAFAKKYIHDGTFHGYWTKYQGGELKKKLVEHLGNWLRERIPEVVAATPEIPAWKPGKSPFPGLVSFTEEYASQFYGRGQEIVHICNRVEDAEHNVKLPFLIITGSSGVGKSSLLKAGVVPELRRRAIAAGCDFRSVEFRPSQSQAGALHSLAEALLTEDGLHELRSQSPHGIAEFVDQLRERDLKTVAFRLDQAIRSVRTPSDQPESEDHEAAPDAKAGTLRAASLRFVLVVDQFEELFTEKLTVNTPVLDPAVILERTNEVSAFASALEMLAERFGFVVLGSMRDDFLPSLNATPELKSVAMHGIFGVGPVASSELHKIIEFPVRAVGFEFEHVVKSNRSLADVICEEATQLGPHGLPMIQFVMQALFERACAATDEKHILKEEDYIALGRVKGVLKQTASSVYASLSYTDKQEARRLFVDLISFGTSTSAKAAGRVREFDLTEKSAAFGRCVDPFVKARLLVQSSSTDQDAVRLSIAHEALIEEWNDLKDWIDENKTRVVLGTLVEDQAVQWHDRGRRKEYLILSNDELHAAEDLTRIERRVKKGDVIRDYVDECTRKYQWRRLILLSCFFLFLAWGLNHSIRDSRFQSFEETNKLLLGSAVIVPYTLFRLVGKWLAMTQAVQRQWRSLYWGCAFLVVYWFWGRHQSSASEGLGYVWMFFGHAWMWLFPAIYHLTVALFGPLTRDAHRLRRRRWWRLYFIVPISVLLVLRMVSLFPSNPLRAIVELLLVFGVIWLFSKMRGWVQWIIGHPRVKRGIELSRNGLHTILNLTGKVWRFLKNALYWLFPPAAIVYGFYSTGPTLYDVIGSDQRNTPLLAAPAPATFFVPAIAVLGSSDSSDSTAWWRAALGSDKKSVVGIIAAPREGECDSQGHPEAIWGHLRRLGLIEGGLAIKGGCNVGRTFDRGSLVEEFVYADIDKPLMRRVARDDGFDLLFANDDGSMSRRGRLVQLAAEGNESRWLYTAFSGRVADRPRASGDPAQVGDRRIWSYSKSADVFRVTRVDEGRRPVQFDGVEFSMVEIGRDPAGRLATLRYLDTNAAAAADANGVHRIDFSYGSRGQCKNAVAKRLDGSTLDSKVCREETRFRFLEVEDSGSK